MDHVSEPEEVLADADGRLHHLLLPAIKKGGQGSVYQTREPNIGVKILNHGERAAEIIRGVRRLHIEDLTSIAAPLSTLQDCPGYVMVWLRGMIPLSESRLPKGGNLQEIIEWYIATGGLRRRLAICARLAEAIADLHSRGLVYVDLSLANVMVSEAGSVAEVRLIDLDNLRSATDQSLSVGTAGWMAPEHYDNVPPSRHSDSYSLALVTFKVLTGQHPFNDGDFVYYAAGDAEVRIDAIRGLLPSFIDPDDSLNATSRYLLPLDVVLSQTLLTMFRRAFGSGRKQIDMRPTAATIRKLFWENYDGTVTCDCGFSSYLDSGACAACDKVFDKVFILEILTSPSSSPVARIAVGAVPVTIERRHLPLPMEPRSRHDELISVSVERDFVVLLAITSEWSCGAKMLRHNDQTELADANGTKLILRAVANAR